MVQPFKCAPGVAQILFDAVLIFHKHGPVNEIGVQIVYAEFLKRLLARGNRFFVTVVGIGQFADQKNFVAGNTAFAYPFADADFSVPIEGNYYLQNGANYDFAVTAGTTYYFSAFVLNPGTFSFNYAASATLQLISATPEAGTVFNAGQHSGVTLAFSRPIAVGGASIIAAGEEKAVAANVLETYATAEIRDALMAFYDKGTLREGDTFTFRLTGVHAAGDAASIYGTDGTVEVTYIAGTRPVTLTATEGIEGASFLSYWRKADERGIIKLRFSGALQPIDTPQREAETTCELSFGDPDAGEGETYRETIHYALSAENEITIDLRNRLRRPIDMVTSGKDYGTMSLKIRLISQNGC